MKNSEYSEKCSMLQLYKMGEKYQFTVVCISIKEFWKYIEIFDNCSHIHCFELSHMTTLNCQGWWEM